jgi:hypothetical protein
MNKLLLLKIRNNGFILSSSKFMACSIKDLTLALLVGVTTNYTYKLPPASDDEHLVRASSSP